MSNIYLQVGKKIRLYRKARKLTQEELGEQLQIAQTYLGRIERGEVNITIETLAKIADALRVKPSQLIEDEKNVLLDNTKNEIMDKIDVTLLPLSARELEAIHQIIKDALVLRDI